MFSNLNNHTNCIQERAGGIVYQDNNLTFDEFLAKDAFFKVHDQNLQKLRIEVFKVKNS